MATLDQVGVFDSGLNVVGYPELLFDSTNKRLVVGGATAAQAGSPYTTQVAVANTGVGASGQALLSWWDVASASSYIIGYHARGSVGTPTHTLGGDTLFSWMAGGRYSSSWTNAVAQIDAIAQEDFTTTSGSYLQFSVTAIGAASLSQPSFAIFSDHITSYVDALLLGDLKLSTNGKSLKQADSGGAYRDVLQLENNNNLNIGGSNGGSSSYGGGINLFLGAGAKSLVLYPSSGGQVFEINDQGQVKLTGPAFWKSNSGTNYGLLNLDVNGDFNIGGISGSSSLYGGSVHLYLGAASKYLSK